MTSPNDSARNNDNDSNGDAPNRSLTCSSCGKSSGVSFSHRQVKRRKPRCKDCSAMDDDDDDSKKGETSSADEKQNELPGDKDDAESVEKKSEKLEAIDSRMKDEEMEEEKKQNSEAEDNVETNDDEAMLSKKERKRLKKEKKKQSIDQTIKESKEGDTPKKEVKTEDEASQSSIEAGAKFSDDEGNQEAKFSDDEGEATARFSDEEEGYKKQTGKATFSSDDESNAGEAQAQFSDDNAQFSDTGEMADEDDKEDNKGGDPTSKEGEKAGASQPMQIPRKKKSPSNNANSKNNSLIANVQPAKPKPKPTMLEVDDEDEDQEKYSRGDDYEDDYENDNYGNDGSVSVSQLKNRILGRQVRTHEDEEEGERKHDTAKHYSTTQEVSPELRKELSCVICHEAFLHPVSLLCGHSFCQECIKWWWQQSTNGKTNCPTCRQDMTLSNGMKVPRVNTALRACVMALLGDELQARLQAEREAQRKATRGENGGAHDAGYEVITSLQADGWKQSRRIPLPCRRSVVLDADDQRMQLALGIWRDSTRGGVHFNLQEQTLQVSLCLLTMEEDEVADGGFPRIVDEDDDEDNEHLLVSRNGGRFVHSFVRAMVKQQAGGSHPLGRRGITASGVVAMSLDLNSVDLTCGGATIVSFQHEESGAILELRVASNSPRPTKKPPGRSASTALELDDDDDDDENDAVKEQGFGSEEDGSHLDRFEKDDFIADEGDEGEAGDNDDCAICHEGGELIVCDGGDKVKGCGRSFHIVCIKHDIIPPGDWICCECANEAGFNVGTEGYEFPEGLEEPCAECTGSEAHIICNGGDNVQGCGSAFHLGCINRTAMPKNDWICRRCAHELSLDVGAEGYVFPLDGETIELSDDDEGDNKEGEEGEFADSPPNANKKRKRLGNKATDVIKIDSNSDNSVENRKTDKSVSQAGAQRLFQNDSDNDSDEELEILPPVKKSAKRRVLDSDDEDD